MAGQFSDKTEEVDLKSMELSIPEGEGRLLGATSSLFSVEYVRVVNPLRPHGICFIYGEISFSNYASGPFVTLFNRSRDNPADIDLADPYFQSLTLSDDGLTSPPHIYGGAPIFIRMKLFEHQSQNSKEPKSVVDDDENDTCIADINFELEDAYFQKNRRHTVGFDGNSGFVFTVAYAVIVTCVTVGVRFTINDTLLDNEQAHGDVQDSLTERSLDIYGIIVGVQVLEDSPSLATRLYYRSKCEAGQVSLGSPIHLDRTFLIAPILEGFLYISYTLYRADNRTLIAEDTIPFPIPIHRAMYFMADKNLTHTRHSKDGLISISLQFMTPVEVDPSDPSAGLKKIPNYDKLK